MSQAKQEKLSQAKKRAGTLEDIIYCYNFVYQALINCFDNDIKDNEDIKELVENDTYLILVNLLLPITTNEIIANMINRYNSKRKTSYDKLLSNKPSLYNQLTDNSIYEHTRQYLKGMMLNIL